MNIPFLRGCVLSAGAALTILSGCSGDSTRANLRFPAVHSPTLAQSVMREGQVWDVLPMRAQRIVQPRFSTGYIDFVGDCLSAPVGFVSDINLNQIYEIAANGTVCATITGLSEPQGLSADKRGNLYVANTRASTILEINESTGAIVNTYRDPNEYPVDVAVDGSGNLAVANMITTNDTAGNLVFYTAGSTGGPTGSASASDYTSPRFLAFAKGGHQLLFDDFDEFNTGTNNAGAIFPGNFIGVKSIVPVTVSNAIAFPGGVQFTPSNQPTILDQGSGSGGTIYTYSVSGITLSVSAATPLSGTLDPVQNAYSPESAKMRTLVADALAGDAALYNFPAGGAPLKTVPLSGSVPVGAAINPTEQFPIP